MKLFEGKSPTERNKIIAAMVLGLLSLVALYFAFGPSGKKTTTTASKSPTPKPSVSPGTSSEQQMPSLDAIDSVYGSTLISYNGESMSAPDAGRNIFAFYEPAPPTPWVATPTPEVKIPTPPPPPTPNVIISFVNPQGVYAGTKAFRMEVSGDKFTPETRIYFSGSEMPTSFISPQQLATDVPANFIAQSGGRIIEVRSPDGKLWSNQFTFNIQEPPRPQFQYVGMIARKRANNDTAYFQESGKPLPFGHRLNDIVAGRFRLVSISAAEVIFEDTSLGFKHKLALFRPAPGAGGTGVPSRGNPSSGFPINDGFNNFTPQPMPQPNPNMTQGIPGIPDNIPRAPVVQPQPRRTVQPIKKDDVDDDDTDN